MRKKIVQPFLNGEELYTKYFSMGAQASILRLTRWALSVGMAKPVKKSFHNKEGLPCMSVWKSMWRWASMQENKDKAFELFAKHIQEHGWEENTEFPWNVGSVVERSEWNRFMAQKIKSAWQFAPKRRERFLQENGWL